MFTFFRRTPPTPHAGAVPSAATAVNAATAVKRNQRPTGQFSPKTVLVLAGGLLTMGVLWMMSTASPPKTKKTAQQKEAQTTEAATKATISTTSNRNYDAAVTQTISRETLASMKTASMPQAAGMSPAQGYPAAAGATSVPTGVIPPPASMQGGSPLPAPAAYNASPGSNSQRSETPRRERDPLADAQMAILAREITREHTALSAPVVVSSRRLEPAPADQGASTSAPPDRTAAPAPPPADLPKDSPPARSAVSTNRPPDDRRGTARIAPSSTATSRNDAAGPLYTLFEGTFFETVLTNRLNSAFTGPVNCMVSTDVWSHSRQHLLIPKGTRILGEAHRVSQTGQDRIAVAFHRLIMPDGYNVSLDKFVGLNQIGETGLRDKVNNHYTQIFGVSIALGAIAGLAQSQSRGMTSTGGSDAMTQGFSTQVGMEATQILNRFLNILPTVTIREGNRVKIYLTNDLALPAYEMHRISSDL